MKSSRMLVRTALKKLQRTYCKLNVGNLPSSGTERILDDMNEGQLTAFPPTKVDGRLRRRVSGADRRTKPGQV